MILAIDFDGVIHDKAHPISHRVMGPPIERAKEALEYLKMHGHVVIVFSVWAGVGTNTIKEWLKYYAIPFDDVTNIKPEADYYIDDKAIKFINWNQVLEEIK